ncbi:TPA: hypothetical protein ACJ5DT_000962 [Legionella pneumophila]|uniref:Uncharacterized protein n=1 Tax=Legionella pneumophila TaxID=446 RepID=A0A2S6F250_LEGPN|nr:hypothetical protein [Legionella pneumophila]APF02782.1 hypothetical protein BIZ52_05180 [Legionella pneumophila subsp. fraseri]APF05814.1 hypothetical protein BIZ51_05295 [Legionella pneumophila subsp. fraseri]AUB68272.1 hypothetical protein BJK09_05215 [Legionella pneumophila]AUB71245.1 hypothetical protein BJK08_05210 [Legionella pneumophila]KXB24425.1 hypothetical protein PtVF66_11040 [Legionella pneumophila]
MSNGWTEERKKSQSLKIRQWKPWQKAGVKTNDGKAISKMNAYKHGGRSAEVREMQSQFTKWKRELSRLINL